MSTHVGSHVGSIGERIRVIAAYTGSSSFPATDFVTGAPTTRWIHRFVSDGNTLIWWTGKPLEDAVKGETLCLVGTVKAHGEYRGVPQTTLTRCSLQAAFVCGECGKPVATKAKKCPECQCALYR